MNKITTSWFISFSCWRDLINSMCCDATISWFCDICSVYVIFDWTIDMFRFINVIHHCCYNRFAFFEIFYLMWPLKPSVPFQLHTQQVHISFTILISWFSPLVLKLPNIKMSEPKKRSNRRCSEENSPDDQLITNYKSLRVAKEPNCT